MAPARVAGWKSVKQCDSVDFEAAVMMSLIQPEDVVTYIDNVSSTSQYSPPEVIKAQLKRRDFDIEKRVLTVWLEPTEDGLRP